MSSGEEGWAVGESDAFGVRRGQRCGEANLGLKAQGVNTPRSPGRWGFDGRGGGSGVYAGKGGKGWQTLGQLRNIIMD